MMQSDAAPKSRAFSFVETSSCACTIKAAMHIVKNTMNAERRVTSPSIMPIANTNSASAGPHANSDGMGKPISPTRFTKSSAGGRFMNFWKPW
jgi:hypothetical protein